MQKTSGVSPRLILAETSVQGLRSGKHRAVVPCLDDGRASRQRDGDEHAPRFDCVGTIMKTTRFATVLIVLAASMATSAFARDDGPRLAQDRLDALVAQHAEAARSIAGTGHDVQRAQTMRDMHDKASS